MLRDWLASGDIDPDTQVRIVPVPPEQTYATLKLGYLDAFCGCEPWNSLAVEAGVGFCLATGAELAPLYPEKVLIVRQSFAAGRAQEHERMLAALFEACAACDLPETRSLLCDMLSHSYYVNAPAEALRASLIGPFDFGDRCLDDALDLTIFHRHDANAPTDQKAGWIIERLYKLLAKRLTPRYPAAHAVILKNIFQRDAFERAKAVALDQIAETAGEMDALSVTAGAGREA